MIFKSLIRQNAVDHQFVNRIVIYGIKTYCIRRKTITHSTKKKLDKMEEQF